MNNKFLQIWKQTRKIIITTLPLVMGVILLISLLNPLLKSNWIVKLFQYNILVDSFLGAIFGSLAAGNPITSYILANKFMGLGVSLAAITAFILSWVTVGLVQLPAETMMLGKKFAILRNVLSFISAILIGLIIQLILS
ncbi:hypothetical protein K8R66_01125 [bacterium]|nr:hypothetical protein [bacterium]